MELYSRVSYDMSKVLTNAYSTSFSMSSRLFAPSIRRHIYAIYGLVRVADEIVDTYMGPDAAEKLSLLEQETIGLLASLTPFSTNPIIQAFVATAQKYDIDASLITPFFDSMRTDLTATSFTAEAYQRYIYGSAEVIGLMCLKVFTDGDAQLYETLAPGAEALGSAYQKVNFLRDIKDDFESRGRVYFPGVTFEAFDDASKQLIEADIERDFKQAHASLKQLPVSARKAIRASYTYYHELLRVIQASDATTIKNKRLSVPTAKKLAIFAKAKVGKA